MPEETCKVCKKESICIENSELVCKNCGSRFTPSGDPISVVSDEVLALIKKASQYENEHKTVREIYTLMEALEIDSKNAAIMVKIGKAYRDSNLLDKSLEYYMKAADLDPLYPQSFINIGVVLSAKLKYEKACEYFEKALLITDEDDPDYAVVLGNYAFALAKSGDRQKAIKMLILADENGYQSCETIRKTFGITIEEINLYNENMS